MKLITAKKIKEKELERLEHSSWKDFLLFWSKFPEYSFANCLLIRGQIPNASEIRSLKEWRSKGIKIKKGQKPLHIYVPCIKKDKESNTEEVTGFILSPMFDISQTEKHNNKINTKKEPVKNPQNLINVVIQLFVGNENTGNRLVLKRYTTIEEQTQELLVQIIDNLLQTMEVPIYIHNIITASVIYIIGIIYNINFDNDLSDNSFITKDEDTIVEVGNNVHEILNYIIIR